MTPNCFRPYGPPGPTSFSAICRTAWPAGFSRAEPIFPSGNGCGWRSPGELLRDSDIIIFDESTANLDPVHEQQLLDVIDRHFSTKTILLISHRESSIARFSRRIHLEKLRERS